MWHLSRGEIDEVSGVGERVLFLGILKTVEATWGMGVLGSSLISGVLGLSSSVSLESSLSKLSSIVSSASSSTRSEFRVSSSKGERSTKQGLSS